MLASILERAGYRTGLGTSPHLVRVNERVRVNGGEISDHDFAAAFTEVSRWWLIAWPARESSRSIRAFLNS